jgi:hypothetical protein
MSKLPVFFELQQASREEAPLLPCPLLEGPTPRYTDPRSSAAAAAPNPLADSTRRERRSRLRHRRTPLDRRDVTVSSTLTVDVQDDGFAHLASFDPPLAPGIQSVCESARSTRRASPVPDGTRSRSSSSAEGGAGSQRTSPRRTISVIACVSFAPSKPNWIPIPSLRTHRTTPGRVSSSLLLGRRTRIVTSVPKGTTCAVSMNIPPTEISSFARPVMGCEAPLVTERRRRVDRGANEAA